MYKYELENIVNNLKIVRNRSIKNQYNITEKNFNKLCIFFFINNNKYILSFIRKTSIH